jgi:hypothetical protein
MSERERQGEATVARVPVTAGRHMDAVMHLVQGLRVQGSGFEVEGSGFRVQGSGFRVQG